MLESATKPGATESTPTKSPQTHPPEFRIYLQNELLSRCRRNPNYSLRAFARALRIDGSALSKMLRGKRAITPSTVQRVASQLGLDPETTQRYQAAVASAAANPQKRFDYVQVSADAFRVISDWYHLAILELTKVEGFEPSAKYVSRALGITASEVNIAVERLQRLGMLEVTAEGWRCTGNHTTGDPAISDAAHRKLQKQVLEKALEALDTTPLEERDQSCISMAVDSRRLGPAREKIARFRREMDEFLSAGGKCDRVCHLVVSLYPVSKQVEGVESYEG